MLKRLRTLKSVKALKMLNTVKALKNTRGVEDTKETEDAEDAKGSKGAKDAKDLEGAKELVFRIRQRLSNTTIQGLPKDFRVTSSFGATIIESDDQDINAIIHRADLALYQAKNNGRDQIQCLTKSQEKEAQTAFDNLETAEKA